MKVNFDQTFRNLDGSTPAEGALTLARAAAEALCHPGARGDTATGEEKFKRGLLAMKVGAGGTHDLTVDELASIKKLVGEAYGPLIVAQAWPMLEGGGE